MGTRTGSGAGSRGVGVRGVGVKADGTGRRSGWGVEEDQKVQGDM